MAEADKTEELETLEEDKAGKGGANEEVESGEETEGSSTEEEPEGKGNKKIIGIVIAALVVIALICGGAYMATASGQEQLQEEVVEEKAEIEVHVLLEADLGKLEVLTDASFAIYEKDNEKISVLKVTDSAINDQIEIDTKKLTEGESYKLYLTETPILSDGSLLVLEKPVEFTFEGKEPLVVKVKLTRLAPEKMSKSQLEETAAALEALGKTELAEKLRDMIEAAPEESEVPTATSPEGTSTASNSNSGGSSQNNGSSNSGNGSGSGNNPNGEAFAGNGAGHGGQTNSNPNEGKTWYEAQYETVVITPAGWYDEPRTGYQNVCYCGTPFTGSHESHASQFPLDQIIARHAGYWTDVPYTYYESVWRDAVTEQRLVRAAGWY